MPNHIINRVTSPDMDKLRKLLLNKEGEVDFNKIVKMPEELMIQAGSCDYGQNKYFPSAPQQKSAFKNIEVILKSLYSKDLTQKEFVDKALAHESGVIIDLIKTAKKLTEEDSMRAFIAGFYNLQKHKAINWYDWSIKKWGTKWNAYESSDEDCYLEFTTAWSSPEPIFLKISKKIPLTVVYADEDICGTNAGVVEYNNGVMIRNDAFEDLTAIGGVLFGTDPECYGDDEDGNPIITNERISVVEKALIKMDLA